MERINFMENIESADDFRSFVVGKSIGSVAATLPEMVFLNKNRLDMAIEAIEILRGGNKPRITTTCGKRSPSYSIGVISNYLLNQARAVWEGPTNDSYMVSATDPFWSRLVNVVDSDLASEMLQCKACIYWLHVDLLAVLASILPQGTALHSIKDNCLAAWWITKKERVILPYLTIPQIITGMAGDPESRISDLIKLNQRLKKDQVSLFVSKLNNDVYKLIEWLFDNVKNYKRYKDAVIGGFLEDPAATNRLLKQHYVYWRLERAFHRFDSSKTPLISLITSNHLSILQYFDIKYASVSKSIQPPDALLSKFAKCVILNPEFRMYCPRITCKLQPDITAVEVYILMYYNHINSNILFKTYSWETIALGVGVSISEFVKNYKSFVASRTPSVTTAVTHEVK